MSSRRPARSRAPIQRGGGARQGSQGDQGATEASAGAGPPPPLSSAVPMPPPPPPPPPPPTPPTPPPTPPTSSPAAGTCSGASPPPPSGPFDLAEQYVALVEQHPPPGEHEALLAHAIFHLRRLCRTPLTEYDLLAELKACKSLEACAGVIQRCRAYAEGRAAFKGRRRPASYWKRQQRRGKI